MGRRSNVVAKSGNQIVARKTARRQNVDDLDSIVIPIQPNIRKTFHQKDLKKITPLTNNQERAFQYWGEGQNLVLEGFAGTGKSFLGMYFALHSVLDENSPYKKVLIVRSAVETGKGVGFLPGELAEKLAPYEAPYKSICDNLFQWKNSYNNLKELGLVEFECSSFLRGTTYDDTIIVVDEIQNMTEKEAETIITRVGRNSRLIICGDDLQTDIGGDSGFNAILDVMDHMKSVSFVDFELQDIVRSGFVKEFLMAKYRDKI